MAKGLRSKVKRKNRSYMRATIGEKVRSAHIVASSSRLEAKQKGRGNVATLLATKGALAGVDLGKEYYEAIVRPSREAVPATEDMDRDEEQEEEEKVQVEALAQEDAIVSQLSAVVPKKGVIKKRLAGSGVFAKRKTRPLRMRDPSRPPKEHVSF